MKRIKEMSFGDYLKETVVPPSGQTIGPSTNAPAKPGAPDNKAPAPGKQMKAIWPGDGAPVERGMTVGLTGANNLPVPGEVTQVDQSAKGVKVKNPTTGQEEWQNIDQLQAFMGADQNKPGVQEGYLNTYEIGHRVNTPLGPGVIVDVSPDINVDGRVSVRLDNPEFADEEGRDTFDLTTDLLSHEVTESQEISRILELAGIRENCSAGATGAGAIAIAPAAQGKIKRRNEPTEESLKTEYTPRGPAKTIIGDTKPNQASGKLSADLAATGKKVASRTNNGFKK